jgi:hypothetical protein
MSGSQSVGMILLVFTAATLCGAASPGAVRAQSFALDADEPSLLWAEIQRPSFTNDQNMSAWLGMVALRRTLGSQVALLAGLPLASVQIGDRLASGVLVPGVSTTAIGMPYIGLRLGVPWRTLAVDAVLGVRVGRPPDTYNPYMSYPYGYVSSSDAMGVAAAQGDYERFESFDRGHPWTARTTALVSRRLSPSVALHLRAGLLAIGGDLYGGNRLFGDLGVATSYARGSTLVNGGLTLRTGNGSLWGARWNVALGLGRSFGRSTPMAFIRIPLGGSTPTGPLARFVIGVGLALRLSDAWGTVKVPGGPAPAK